MDALGGECIRSIIECATWIRRRTRHGALDVTCVR
jgi:hypothetical protein